MQSTNYLAIYGPTATGFSASFPDLSGLVVTARDEASLVSALEEALALHLSAMREDGDELPEPSPVNAHDLEPGETPYMTAPAPMNPVSLEVGRAIAATGKSLRQLQRETGISYAVLSRLQDPFYWGHSLASLRQLAGALGLKLEVKLGVQAA